MAPLDSAARDARRVRRARIKRRRAARRKALGAPATSRAAHNDDRDGLARAFAAMNAHLARTSCGCVGGGYDVHDRGCGYSSE